VRIKIDPVTRIEGHLRLEAEVAEGRVRTAWASGTMFRAPIPGTKRVSRVEENNLPTTSS
jgi:hypothetical protein